MNPITWYIPSFTGDIRFTAETETKTVVTIIDPTMGELDRLQKLSAIFQKKKWIEHPMWNDSGPGSLQVAVVEAPILDVAPYLVADYAPGRATLTAIRVADDRVEAYEAGTKVWESIRKALGLMGSRSFDAVPVDDEDEDPEPAPDTYRSEAEDEEEEEEKPKEEPKKVVTVKRPSVCCPQCIEGPLTPASEVLFSFLTDEEKREYAENDHSIVVTGGITGHRYLLSHRHGRWARHYTKICHDLDTGHTLHFHDHTVPPEEELLASKLILEHRENWLRTPGSGAVNSMPSGFGDGTDGMKSTSFTWSFGRAMTRLEDVFTGGKRRTRSRRRGAISGGPLDPDETS